MNTKDKIEIMQAYLAGKMIESKALIQKEWFPLYREPNWNWEENQYRVAVAKDSIDWSQVNPIYRYMARESNGDVYLYATVPAINSSYWANPSNGEMADATAFVSYKKGDADWKDSLVAR